MKEVCVRGFLFRYKLGVMIGGVFVVLVLCFVSGCAGGARGAKESDADGALRGRRQAFAKAFAQLKEGMSAEEALAILGKPDDVRTQTDPGGIGWTGTREIWGYGVDRHLGFATLGSVAIDESGRVQHFSGTRGAEELVAQVGERKLRRLLRVLSRTATNGLDGEKFNPRDTLAAVNALQPLGKRIGVAVMREYLQIHGDEDEGLIVVMRALFEVPPGYAYFRPARLGAPDWSPVDISAYPRFPLCMIDDIPVLLINGYTLAGVPESASAHLEYLQEVGRWRAKPLKPSDDPFGVYAKIMERLGGEGSDNVSPATIAGQFLRLIDTVYRDPALQGEEDAVSELFVMASFREAERAAKEVHIRWDSGSNCYVRGDGTTLPPLVAPVYRRSIFEPHLMDGDYQLTIIVERRNSGWVDVTCDLANVAGASHVVALSMVRPGTREASSPDGSVFFIRTPEKGQCLISTFGRRLSAGEALRVEVAEGEHRFVSSAIEP